MKKTVAKISSIALALGAVVGGSSSAEALSCTKAPILASSVATHTKVSGLPGGASAGYFSMKVGVANKSKFPTRVAYIAGALGKLTVAPVHAELGKASPQLDMAKSRAGSIGYINTDFYNTKTKMPASAIIYQGKLSYSPPQRTKVLAMAPSNYTESAGYPALAKLTAGSNTVEVTGVNLSSIGANSAVAFTSLAANSTIAKGSIGVLISNGEVSAIYQGGTNDRPTLGILIQATGTAAAALGKLSLGQAVNFALPEAPAYKLLADSVLPTGYLQTNSVKIPISAVNYNGAVSNGAVLYDSKYSKTVSQGLLGATLVLDRAGKVAAYYPTARNVVPTTANPTVLQITAKSEKTLKAPLPSKGMAFKVYNTFQASSGAKLISATGRRDVMLANGVNKVSCTASSELIRPRSVLGWNKYGQFWMVSSGMGMAYEDNGFREGGATIHQMADFLKQFGATEAVPFDGGGSVTMFANPGSGFKRIDLPANAVLRNAPVGLVVLANN